MRENALLKGMRLHNKQVKLPKMAYLENTDKKECNHSRKSHMNHGKSYGEGKIEVLWRENPLQINHQIINHYNIKHTGKYS